MIIIKIETGNAAFQDGNRAREVATMLHKLADRLVNSWGCCPASLYDSNGNKVGEITLTGKDREL